MNQITHISMVVCQLGLTGASVSFHLAKEDKCTSVNGNSDVISQ